MIVNKKVFLQLVQEEVHRQEKKMALLNRAKELEQEIKDLDNSSPILKEFVSSPVQSQQGNMYDTGNMSLGQSSQGNMYDTGNMGPGQNQQLPSMMDNGNYDLQQVDGAQQGEDESESIFDAKPGETVIFNFQDVTIKLQRQLDDLFKVVDAAESQKLNDGDYVKIQGNDQLKKGRKFNFNIYRVAGVKYQSNPLAGWKVIKNR